MNIRKSYHFYAALTILLWSLAYVFTRLALEHFTAFPLGFIRYFIASALLIAVAVLTKMKRPELKDIPIFIAAGFFGFFFYMISFNQGQGQVSSATASVVIATAPVISAFMARFIYGEKLRKYKWLAIVIEFAGVVVLTLLNGVFSVNSGLWWLFGAAVAFSIYNLMQKSLTGKYTSLQASTYSIYMGTIMLAVFAPSAVSEIVSAPPIQYVYIAILSIGSSAMAYVLWAKALSLTDKTAQVSNYMFGIPFIASLMGFIFAGEVPDRATLIGGGIILVGMLIFNFGDRIFKIKEQ